MNRRHFLATGAALPLLGQAKPIPIIDTHIHLYDTARKEGVPWPPKENTLIYKPTYPSRFRETVKGMNVVGAIEVECSPWFNDNQWVLDVMAKEPVMVGMIGNLEPEKADFKKALERFTKNPLYLGIRYGYLWGRNPAKAVADANFISGCKDLAAANLTLDTANASAQLLRDMVVLSDKVPNLRIVLDHMGALYPPKDAPGQKQMLADLAELGKRPQVFCKGSATLRMVDNQKVPYTVAAHKSRLDLLWKTFGDDRIFYGSDWPNSDPSNPYSDGLRVMQEYVNARGRESAEKYFWKNSIKAYRWKARDKSQPS